MPDWALYDSQLQQFHAEGVTPAEIARRVSLAPQTVRDRLIKLGLLTTRPKTKTSPTQEAATPEPRVSALAAVIHTDTDPVSVEEASTFVDTLPAIAEEASTFVDSVPTVLEEPQTLQHYENMIEAGMKAFVKAGRALQRIRDLRLYRDTSATFEAYCRQRWNLSRPRAYQLIAAADVVENLRQSVRILPTNEAQARELASLTPELQAEVWGEVVETAPERKITATHVKRTVARVKAQDQVIPPKPKAPETRRPARHEVQEDLAWCLSEVRDDEAWPILEWLWDTLNGLASTYPTFRGVLDRIEPRFPDEHKPLRGLAYEREHADEEPATE
jgi:hypothetical protein